MKVKLREVVDKIVGNEDRLETDRKYYIGGEHLDSGNIAIRNYGLLDSSKGRTLGYQFHYPFEIGDVLFMTKNPYLRKCGKVFVPGICSIATFVLRTKDVNVLNQDFLAVITQTDDFWNYMEANKSGSVNYFITWTTLADYEFELPSIDKQKEIAELAWSIQEVKESYEDMLQKTDALVQSRFIEMFGDPLLNDRGWPLKTMDEVAPSVPYKGKVDEVDGKHWLLNLDMVESGTGRIIEKLYFASEDMGQSISAFSSEYVLYSKLRPYLNKVVLPNGSGYATNELVALLPDSKYLTREYLAKLLMGNAFLGYIKNHVSGTKMPRVIMDDFWKFNVMLPPLDKQKEFTDFAEQADKSKAALQQSLYALNRTYKKIIAENLG